MCFSSLDSNLYIEIVFTFGQCSMKDYMTAESQFLKLWSQFYLKCHFWRVDPCRVDSGETDSKEAEVGLHPAESFC